MKALIRFGKGARLRFISHLDMQRFFQRALNRTNLPIAFSNGFNPHPLMSFASALALGWTSEYEVLEVRFAQNVTAQGVKEAMARALPDEMPVFDAVLVDDKHPAPMAELVAADYEISFAQEGPGFSLVMAVEKFLQMEHVNAVRKTKSGEKEMDARPLAYELKVKNAKLYCRLALTQDDTLKPDVLVGVLAGLMDAPVPECAIHRTCLLKRNAKGEFAPIMEK